MTYLLFRCLPQHTFSVKSEISERCAILISILSKHYQASFLFQQVIEGTQVSQTMPDIETMTKEYQKNKHLRSTFTLWIFKKIACDISLIFRKQYWWKTNFKITVRTDFELGLINHLKSCDVYESKKDKWYIDFFKPSSIIK